MDTIVHIYALKEFRRHTEIQNWLFHYNGVERWLSCFIFGIFLG